MNIWVGLGLLRRSWQVCALMLTLPGFRVDAALRTLLLYMMHGVREIRSSGRLLSLTSEARFPCLQNEANSISFSSHNQPRREIAVPHHLPSVVKSCSSDHQNEHDPLFFFFYINPHSCLLWVTFSHLDICKSSNCWPFLWPPTVHTLHSI